GKALSSAESVNDAVRADRPFSRTGGSPPRRSACRPVRADQERRNFRAQSHSVTALPVFGSSLWPPVGTSRVRVAASTRTGLSQDSASEGEWDARGAMPKDPSQSPAAESPSNEAADNTNGQAKIPRSTLGRIWGEHPPAPGNGHCQSPLATAPKA